MSRIFDDLSFNTPSNVYAGAPVEEYKALNAEASKQYQTNRTANNVLEQAVNNLDVRDIDYRIKKRVIEDTKAKLKDLHENGDYQNADLLLNNISKNIAMDNELKDALKSREQEKQYYNGLRSALEQGQSKTGKLSSDSKEPITSSKGITRDIYNYALEKSRMSNKQPLKYNPNTMLSENMFRGEDVSPDLSKEIYDNMDKRIKEWQPETPQLINGEQIKKTTNSPTGYFNITTQKEVRPEEVSNALRLELENTGEYRDFLNQEKAIDFHNRFKNNDGTYREVSKTDLGLSDDKIKTIISGISKDTLDKLSLSKNTEDKQKAEKYSELRNSINLNTLSQKDLSKLYDIVYTENQTSKYINPATSKGSYSLFEDKYLEDRYGVENLRFQHEKALQKAKAEVTVKAAPENVSQLEQYKFGDIVNQQKSLEDVQKEVQQIKTQLPYATESTAKELTQRLQILDNKSKIIQNNNSTFEDDMNNKGYNVDEAYETYIFQATDSEMKDKLFNTLLNLPLPSTTSNIKLINQLQLIKQGKETMGRDEFMNLIKSDSRTNQIFKNIKNEINQKIANTDFNDIKVQLGDVETARHNNKIIELQNLQSGIIDRKKEFLDKEQTKSIATSFIPIDENNNNTDKGTSANNTNIAVRDETQSSLRNGSNWHTKSGTSLMDIINNSVQGYELVDDKGKDVPADLSQTKATLSSKSIGGEVPVGAMLRASDGSALYFKSGGQATILVYPENPEVTSEGLSKIGRNYLQHGESNSDRVKGIQYLADAEYKTQLESQITPAYWNNKDKGYEEDVVLNVSGKQVQYKIRKENTGDTPTEVSIVPINSNTPKQMYNLNGKPISTFKSLDELSTVLYYNNNYNEVAPYIK